MLLPDRSIVCVGNYRAVRVLDSDTLRFVPTLVSANRRRISRVIQIDNSHLAISLEDARNPSVCLLNQRESSRRPTRPRKRQQYCDLDVAERLPLDLAATAICSFHCSPTSQFLAAGNDFGEVVLYSHDDVSGKKYGSKTSWQTDLRVSSICHVPLVVGMSAGTSLIAVTGVCRCSFVQPYIGILDVGREGWLRRQLFGRNSSDKFRLVKSSQSDNIGFVPSGGLESLVLSCGPSVCAWDPRGNPPEVMRFNYPGPNGVWDMIFVPEFHRIHLVSRTSLVATYDVRQSSRVIHPTWAISCGVDGNISLSRLQAGRDIHAFVSDSSETPVAVWDGMNRKVLRSVSGSQFSGNLDSCVFARDRGGDILSGPCCVERIWELERSMEVTSFVVEMMMRSGSIRVVSPLRSFAISKGLLMMVPL